MKTIDKTKVNVIDCGCGTVIEYDKSDLTLKGVEGTNYYAISVVCPACGKRHIVNPADYESPALLASIKIRKCLDDYSPEELSTIAKNGNASEFWVHECVTFTLKNGYNAVFEVIGIDHDICEDGAKTGITFCLVDLYGDNDNGGEVMNSECTNAGGFDKSELCKWLNEEFYALLPDEWQKIIVPVVKKTANGGGSKAKVVDTVCKVFIPSEVEVFGECHYSKKGEGEQYEGFKHWKDRIKGYPDSTYGRYWWLRSPYLGSNNGFCVVTSGGSYYANGYAGDTYGVAPCFAI